AAVAATDGCAVGQCSGSPSAWPTLTWPWDGSSWSRVPSPNQGTSRNDLFAVSAVSSNDVWAVGFDWQFATLEEPLTLHWDGSTWSVIPGPNTYGRLEGVAAISSNDVWAVGAAGTLHWDGSQWSTVPIPCDRCL